MKASISMNIKYRLIPWALTPYYKIFTLIIWQPVLWDLIKPKNGVIDNKAHWFHRHAVTCLNKVRANDTWVMMSIFGLKVRDPYAHIENKYYWWSKLHLFAIHK